MLTHVLQQPLEAAIKTIKEKVGDEIKVSEFEPDYAWQGKLEKEMDEAAAGLVPIISGISELEIFNQTMRGFANGWSSMSYRDLAYSMVKRSFDVGSHQAMDELNKYVNATSFPAYQMLMIGGISVEQTIQLANGVELRPFSVSEEGDRKLLCTVGPIPAEAHRITSAFVKIHPHPREHQPIANFKSIPIMSQLWDLQELDDALLCATLIGPSGAARLATSIGSVNWIPAFGGPSGQEPYMEDLRGSIVLDAQSTARLQDIYKRFVGLKPDFKSQLRLPMIRLNMAMRRRWHVDAAIDVGIALESLFGEKDSSNDSIGFTLRLRASRLLRSSLNERLELCKKVKLLYDLRSAAAHTGKFPEKNKGGLKPEELIQIGFNITAEAIEHMIMNGKPNWDHVIYN